MLEDLFDGGYVCVFCLFIGNTTVILFVWRYLMKAVLSVQLRLWWWGWEDSRSIVVTHWTAGQQVE